MVRTDEVAPDFELPGIEASTDGAEPTRRTFKLSDYRGQTVVVAFYPGDSTPVCTRQLNSYTAEIDEFRDVGAQLLAISPQSVDSHIAFSTHEGGFAFPLLADTDKKVAERYGILGPLGFYRRSVFVVDPEGIVRYAHRALGLRYRPTEALVAAVRRTRV
jgi:thioredoxin-dependent peroxiredoxin